MADTKSDKQLLFEQRYIDKITLLNEIQQYRLQEVQVAAQNGQANADSSGTPVDSGTLPPIDGNVSSAITGGQVLLHNDQSKYTVGSGSFALPDSIQMGIVSGGYVKIANMNRSAYYQARVIATQGSKAAGFRSISEDMYYFVSGVEYENIFAPDFINVLTFLHSKIGKLFRGGRVQTNSGFRWWKQSKNVQYSPHEAGCAIDVGCVDDLRYQIADTAWEIGLRGVFVGETFVHIDLGPDGGGYSYPPVPMYRGPESHR